MDSQHQRASRLPRRSSIFVLLCGATSCLSAASYAPVNTSCPSEPLVRTTGSYSDGKQSLSGVENEYNSRRAAVLAPQWHDFYASGIGSKTGYDPAKIAPSTDNLPRIGIAISGGGYRSALYGVGVLDALDSRNSAAVQAGTGGYFQLASYLTGLSGGSWAVTSLATNDWPPIRTLVQGSSPTAGDGWNLDIDLSAPNIPGVINPIEYTANILQDILAKNAAFPGSLSVVDAWGRYIAYHFAPGTTTSNFSQRPSADAHAAGLVWSDAVQGAPAFQAAQVPMPIAVTDSRPFGYTGVLISPDFAVYEYTPFEFGSYDPSLSAFVNVTYLGTSFSNGSPQGQCVTGFDSVSFVMGTSGNIFNFAVPALQLAVQNTPLFPALQAALRGLGQDLSTVGFDVGKVPNPFAGIKSGTYEASNDDRLNLVDGGWNGENLPLNPLLVKSRNVDVIIALDAGGDPTSNPANHPDGASIYQTSNRSQIQAFKDASGKLMPDLPNTRSDFLDSGYNLRPTFFGCSEDEAQDGVPLLLYLPNAPYWSKSMAGKGFPDATGPDFYSVNYTNDQVEAFLDTSFAIATRGWPTDDSDINAIDSNWPTCMACAVSERARVRNGLARTDQCQSCLQRYCAGDVGSGKAVSGGGGGGGKHKGAGSRRAWAGKGIAIGIAIVAGLVSQVSV